MLQAIRDRVSGVIAWGIVIFISIPFALWGIQEYIGANTNVAVATIDGEEVTLPRFQRFYQAERTRIRNMFGGQLPPSLLEEGLRERALDSLVQEEVVLQTGLNEGMGVGDQQLFQTIQSEPSFQIGGNFSQAAYDSFLQTQGYSSAGFEQELRRNMMLAQVTRGMTMSALATSAEVDRLEALRTQERRFRVLDVPKSGFEDAQISEEQITGFYDTNRAEFRTPEKLDIEYIEVSRQDISQDIAVDEADLKARYDLNVSSYGLPEQREASHILIRVAQDAEEDAVKTAREKAQALAAQLDEGADFAALAKENSEDPLSAVEGGSLGAFGKDVMDPAFEEAAFALAEGEVSDPVRSAFGFHLIKLDAIQASTTRSFEEMRDTLAAELKFERAEQDYFHRVEELANLSFEHPDSLDTAALALDVEPQRLDGLTREPSLSAGEIEGNPAIVEAAFSADVLDGGNNSELLELDGERALVLRVAERHPAQDRAIDEVREDIVKRLSDEAAAKAAADAGRAATLALREGRDAADVASERSAAWSEVKRLGRQSQDADAEVLKLVFRMPVPGEGSAEEPLYDGVATAAGDFVVVELLSVERSQEPEPSGESQASAQTAAQGGEEATTTEVAASTGSTEQEASTESASETAQTEANKADDPGALAREQSMLALRSTLGRGEYDAYVKALRSRADVQIFEQNLQN